MESTESAALSAGAKPEPHHPAAPDDAVRPATVEIENDPQGQGQGQGQGLSNMEPATKSANAAAPPSSPAASNTSANKSKLTNGPKGRAKGHKPSKAANKSNRNRKKVVKTTIVADSDDSSSDEGEYGDESDTDDTDDESEGSSGSDDTSSSGSDSDSQDGQQKKKKKKKQNGRKTKQSSKTGTRGSKTANKQKRKDTKASRRPAVSDSDSDSDSDSGSSSDSGDHKKKHRARKGRQASVSEGDDELSRQVQSMQAQLSQLQRQVLQPAVWPVNNGFPAFGVNNAYFSNAGASGLNTGNAPPPMRRPPPGPGRIRRRGGGGGQALRRAPADSDARDSAASDSQSEEKRKSRRKKDSSRADFKRVDWIWDNSLYSYKLQDTAESTNESLYNDYIFHVRRTFDCENKYRETYVDIKSKLLRECLKDVIGNVQGVSLVDETPKLDPNLLFLYLEEFREHRKHLKVTEPAGDSRRQRKKNQKRIDNKRKQLKVLIKYLDKDYAKVKESLYPMLESGLITFDLLWALWKPNTLAYTTTYSTSEEPRVFKVDLAERHSSMVKGDFYYVDGKYLEFDGKRFGHGSISEELYDFHGARKITSLNCYPLKYHKNEAQVRSDLIERGKKFVALGGMHFRGYSGLAFAKRKKGMVVKFNVQPSRIMIDPIIFRRINPNYFISVIRSRDHDLLSDDEDSDEAGCCGGGGGSSDDEVKYVQQVFKNKKGQLCIEQVPKSSLPPPETASEISPLKTNGDAEAEKTDKAGETPVSADSSTEAQEVATPAEFSDEDYLIASPVVFGFSFSEKQWLEFRVSGVSDIKWNDKAWDSLVLEPSTKDLIQALVQSRKYNATQTIDDVIQGKGKGLVTVLHGPPGTGKTLTAEGISELLRCPLYMVSAGELGTDSRILEGELQKILDICHAWGAILLLDEADVFLEKRDMHEIHRNALVSIFLRQLEYFQGILFLTTNRVETFDEAFQSRIHIALRYEALDSKAKKAIFSMFIERVRAHGKLGVQAFSEEDYAALSKRELNGREIKNVVGSAQDLAMTKGEALGMRHIRQVLDVYAKFGRDLRGGSGFEDAMRSYF